MYEEQSYIGRQILWTIFIVLCSNLDST